jgi:hypothetical protein
MNAHSVICSAPSPLVWETDADHRPGITGPCRRRGARGPGEVDTLASLCKAYAVNARHKRQSAPGTAVRSRASTLGQAAHRARREANDAFPRRRHRLLEVPVYGRLSRLHHHRCLHISSPSYVMWVVLCLCRGCNICNHSMNTLQTKVAGIPYQRGCRQRGTYEEQIS